MGFPAGVTVCPSDEQRLTGGCSELPYEYLKTHYTPGAESSREGGRGISMLNPDFACRLSKFLKAADTAGQRINIGSAWRSNETQSVLFQRAVAKYGSTDAARKWVAPPGSSMHNKGLAVDLSFQGTGAQNWAHTNIEKFNLYFRMGHEPWHVEPKGGISGGTAPGAGSPATSGPWPANDVSRTIPPGYCIASIEPLQYVPCERLSQCPAGYVAYNGQCYPLQGNQPLGAAQQPFQQSQPMQTGQPASMGQPSYPSTPSSYGTPGNTSTNTDGATRTGSTNNLNLVEAIINGTSTATSTAVGTSGAFSSNSLSSTASYGDGTPAGDTLLSTATNAATNTLTFDQLTSSQGTFSTTDIGTAVDITATSSRQSFLRVALENLRRRLVYLLEVLGLMRHGAPAQEIKNLPLPQLLPLNEPNTLPQADEWHQMAQ
jgi:hypothetical protein